MVPYLFWTWANKAGMGYRFIAEAGCFISIFISAELECLGIPLEGSSWPYYNYDYERNLLFGRVSWRTGQSSHMTPNPAGCSMAAAAKHGIAWYSRCTMLDKDTGVFYSSSPDPENPGVGRIVPAMRGGNNEFTWLKLDPARKSGHEW